MKRTVFIILTSLTAAGILGIAVNYGRIPDIVPMHWNVHGAVDGFAPKWVLWILGGLPFIVGALALLPPLFDPRKESFEKHGKAFAVTIVGIVAVLEIVLWIVLLNAIGFAVDIKTVLLFTLAVLFGVIGNYMPQIRPNYTFGIRTPWTLESEHVWRKTHRAGGYVFLTMAAAFFVGSFLKGFLAVMIIAPVVFLGVLCIFIYSFVVFRQEQAKHRLNKRKR